MEDAWQREAKDFRDRISKFEDENRKLRKAVSEMTGIEACKRSEWIYLRGRERQTLV